MKERCKKKFCTWHEDHTAAWPARTAGRYYDWWYNPDTERVFLLCQEHGLAMFYPALNVSEEDAKLASVAAEQAWFNNSRVKSRGTVISRGPWNVKNPHMRRRRA